MASTHPMMDHSAAIMNKVIPMPAKTTWTTTTTVRTTSTTKDNFKSDLIVLLDIDHTMIFAQAFDSKAAAEDYVKGMPKTDMGRSVRYFQLAGADNSGQVFHLNCRPFLKEFLETICANFEVYIFTAGTLEYAKAIVSILDPQGRYLSLDRIWSRADCFQGMVPTTVSEEHPTGYEKQYLKILSVLPFKNLSRVVLIDDNWLNFKANPNNMIKVDPFTDDPHDEELVSVLKLLMEKLKDCENVRPILTSMYESSLSSP
jgi:RNA polymerase II C-terminal domain phosphatase-like 3/4